MPVVSTTPVRDTRQLRGDAARITELLASDLAAPVPGCHGWDLRELVSHLGVVHRWARSCVGAAQRPASGRRAIRDQDAPPLEPDALARWFGDGAIGLANTLDAADPDAPSWTPFDVDAPTVAFWIRRQTHETSLHRWDAESAVTTTRPIGPELAADGIDEYLDVILPTMLRSQERSWPTGSVHLHCTDTPGEWTAEAPGGAYVLDRSHRKGDAAVRGSAEHLLLVLWGRSVPDDSVEVLGDDAVGRAWTTLGGS